MSWQTTSVPTAAAHPGCARHVGDGLHLAFFFTDHAPDISAAVEHWFCLAAAALENELTELPGDGGFAISLDEVRDCSGATALVPTDEDIVVANLKGEEEDAHATSEEAPLFEELPEQVQRRARAARQRGQRGCSICGAPGR